jgi:cation diffusion facilitator CzcD-associated flavoprotein CzcO
MADSLWSKLRILLALFVVYLTICLTVVIGFIGQFLYWIIFDVFVNAFQRTNRKLNVPKAQNKDEYYALIIGSGFSGLGMAIKLKELGTDNFIIIERHGHVGGTWYANTYPGCTCDVPSNLYSFSFEPNPKWSYFFGRQPEIGQYLENCTDKYDIRRHVKFNTTVTQLKWIDNKQVWEVTSQSNNQENIVYARFVMAGYGPLSNASFPTDIPGIDKFEGQMCHTAEWDKTIDFKNKRVAVIGTGASAIQTVPEIEKVGVKELLVFQRTPGWILPRVDKVVTDWEKQFFTRYPIFQKLLRGVIYWLYESVALSFSYRLPIRHALQRLVEYNLDRQVEDKELRGKLTPLWDLGCKRILPKNDWYPTLQKPNVKLVTNRIREVKLDSIVTHDGDEYPVDIIIWATGYQVQKFSLPVYGVNGRSLTEQWSETIQVYILFSKICFQCFFS